MLQNGNKAWNAWRVGNPNVWPDLSGVTIHTVVDSLREANLRGANLRGATLGPVDSSGANLSEANLCKADFSKGDLREANLSGATLSNADLSQADLRKADLRGAKFREANLSGAKLCGADLFRAKLREAKLRGADLRGVNLSEADLRRADLSGAKFCEANLVEADLCGADLSGADLSGADLSGAKLREAKLIKADFAKANLTGCRIYGISAWGLKISKDTEQKDLVVTPPGVPEVTADDIEVAQFIYMMLDNEKLRRVIDTITTKVVLILGRFTKERKEVLDSIREELRKGNYVPILFDFEKPAGQNLTATVSTLARLARFIIADLTEPSCIPYELGRIVPNTKVPVQPILSSRSHEFTMFADLQDDYHWVLAIHHYDTKEQLIDDLYDWVIRPAEAKVLELQGRRRDSVPIA